MGTCAFLHVMTDSTMDIIFNMGNDNNNDNDKNNNDIYVAP
jgi:hypothetical protein